MPVSKNVCRRKDMKIRLDFLIYSILALTGTAKAQTVMNLQEHRQTLLYAFIALSALLFILVVWEILDMMSKKERIPVTKPQVSVIGEMEESSPEEEDPIKALLKKQAEVISAKEEEEELPAFLRESSSSVEDLADQETPPPGMPVKLEKSAPMRIPESSPDSDPFKALLIKSVQKEDTTADQDVRDESVEPTIPLAKLKGKVIKKEDEDPFKSLLKSKREEKVAPEAEQLPPVKRTTPTRETPAAPVSMSSQSVIGQPSGVELKVPKIKGLKPPHKDDEKRISLTPPQQFAEKEMHKDKDKDKDKKISFSLPGKKKSRSVGRLFSRLSEANKSEEENQTSGRVPAGKITPDVIPEGMESDVSFQEKTSESLSESSDKSRVVIKLPDKQAVAKKPDRPKIIELDIEGKKTTRAVDKPEPGGSITFRPTQKKAAPIQPTKRLSLSLPSSDKSQPIRMKSKSGEIRNPMDTNSLQAQPQIQEQKQKEQERSKPRPQPTKIFRQIPKPVNTKMLNLGGLPQGKPDDRKE